jgi:hypothetical protein
MLQHQGHRLGQEYQQSCKDPRVQDQDHHSTHSMDLVGQNRTAKLLTSSPRLVADLRAADVFAAVETKRY